MVLPKSITSILTVENFCIEYSSHNYINDPIIIFAAPGPNLNESFLLKLTFKIN